MNEKAEIVIFPYSIEDENLKLNDNPMVIENHSDFDKLSLMCDKHYSYGIGVVKRGILLNCWQKLCFSKAHTQIGIYQRVIKAMEESS